jgi:hypothetical protein
MIKFFREHIGIDWVIQKLSAASNWLFSAIGFALLCGGFVLAALVERKDLAVALTFATTFLGTAISSANWQLREIRTEVLSQEEVAKIYIDPHDKRLMKERDQHEEQLRNRISAGQCFTVFEKPVLKAASEVLKSLLSPLVNRLDDIVFVEHPPSDATPFLDFLANEQKRIAQRRRELDAPGSGQAKANEKSGT